MRRTSSLVLIGAALGLFGIWFYFMPYLAVRSMRKAAEAKDSVKLSDYIDFPAVRESMKAMLNARFAQEMMKNPDNNRFAGLGLAFAALLVGPMVDALITPESIALMMMSGEKPEPGPGPQPSNQPAAATQSDVDVFESYETFDRFVVTVKKNGSPDEPIQLVFTRHGWLSWKLSALRLPP